jgi:hypothetical protein
MYTVNFIAQLERNSLNPSRKIIGWDLVGHSLVTTSFPFKSKIKWYSLTFDSPRDFSNNQDVIVISCDPCSECGSYVNVSLKLKNFVQTIAWSNPIIWFSSDGDRHSTYDFTKCTHWEENPHIEKIKKTILANPALFWTFNGIRQIFVMAWSSNS